ncbi:hypothetical protein SLH49_19265 [Cognatiyoonia sp. IB215446]|uniref:hypothetical protein n=1 Tax=Cognatiyoonia sp. IB215446 TaxID=3097355 RepID=UPI002A13BD61|nr:hypothetical protein [Cognatiyoonia sp. IB215446]MDX8350137.1 hypothetical protein [Cognatiyoonia sp. IB215446]
MVGCEIGAYDLSDVNDWAATQLADCEAQDELVFLSDLMHLNDLADVRYRHDNPLLRLVRIRHHDHRPEGAEVAEYAKQIWLEALRQYLEGVGEPDDISNLVGWIEVRCDYPKWLGNMYNACDWAPNDRSLSPQIEDEARAILETIQL